MKIKLIIIVFSISCLFFPGGLMEADALPIGPILKGVKELVEHTPGIVKVQTGKTTFLQAKNNWCKQNQESCTANNEIMYKELSFDKYGIKSLQIPSGWEVSLHEGSCDDGVCSDMLAFTDGGWWYGDGVWLLVAWEYAAPSPPAVSSHATNNQTPSPYHQPPSVKANMSEHTPSSQDPSCRLTSQPEGI
jgi:hypothetical protein